MVSKKKKRAAAIKQGDVDSTIGTLHEYSVLAQTREIWLQSFYGEGPEEEEAGVDHRTLALFSKNLALLNRLGPGNILVHQGMIGGDWNYGVAIYDAIRASRAPVTMVGYAHVRSMSSITFQAAKRRVLMPNTEVVLHYGWVEISDRTRAAKAQMRYAEKVDNHMLLLYAQRMKDAPTWKTSTLEKICHFLENQFRKTQDWIMDADQAVHYGLADGILGVTKGFETLAKIRK
jgi:ATP-dependent protease ClpP protease subunit